MKCIHCAIANMPEANFCQGCGLPLSAAVGANKLQPDAAQPQRQHVCFRCSAPLAADAKVCEKCGLDVQNLINPPSQPQQAAGRAADLAEVTFFSQPTPPDPQLAILKTYASWLVAILFAVIASFAAYSWLEASNVIGRLIGENASRTQQPLEPLSAVIPQRKAAVPSFIKGEDEDSNTQNAVASAANSTETAAMVETTVTESAALDKALPDHKPAKAKYRAVANKPRSSANAAKIVAPVLPPLPATKPKVEATEPQQQSVDSSGQAVAPEAEQSPTTTSMPQAPAAQAQHKKRVEVTQIEPNKDKKHDAKAVSPVEDFFRRWKKSVKQGVTNRPCTQQEKVLNQCYK